MFDGKYFEWNKKRAKGIIDFYGYKFFYFKKLLDLGCGHGDLGGTLYRLGADVVALDARQEHLKVVGKKFNGIKTVQANLDVGWPFHDRTFDIILDLGLICHLADYETHLKKVCASATHLVLETAVCDSDDQYKCVLVDEDKGTYDLSYGGKGCRPSAAAIERVLTDCNMNFKRMDNAKFNAGDYVYDWYPENDNSVSLNKRRIWFAVSASSPIQFFNPNSKITTGSTFSLPVTAKADAEAEAKAKAQAEAEARVRLQMQAQARAEAEAKAEVDAEAKVKAEAKSRAESEAQDRARTQAEARTKARAKAQAEAEARAKAQIEAQVRALSELKSKPEVKPETKSKIKTKPELQLELARHTFDYNQKDKKFVIVIPSYKNQKWCEKNIQSALTQDYNNYRIIFTDDCSPDDTFSRVSQIVINSSRANKVSLTKNEVRLGALANLYNMIHSCEDDEIILTLDGDDWLSDNNVLNKLNKIYSDGDTWITYGQYQNSTDKQMGCARQYPPNVIKGNSFRQNPWGASHLRTFYTWLFKNIKKEDLMYKGDFYSMTWDFAIMFPMLEMAGPHSKYISDILYIYNLENPINDHKINVGLQQALDREIRSKQKYQRVESPPVKLTRTKVGLLLIATSKYSKFVQGLISSADKFFLDPSIDVTYYVFSDQQIQIQSQRNVVPIFIEHKKFPFASMDRFKHFTNNATILSKEDYLYYVDVDCLFADHVGKEILGDLVGVRHCGFTSKKGPYETNLNSCLYVNNKYPKHYKHYYGGGFSGGKSANYLELSKWCYERIEQDVANNIIPIWHDETALNRYFLDYEPTITLSPEYHYPQSNISMYKKMWGTQNWRAKILLLDKNHSDIRK
jgi:glycosyltransferase involved in cell wall biosynthesis/SAM-dependent methyltransferase